MRKAESFEQIVEQQAAAVAAALVSEAESAGVSLPSGLAERLGRAIARGDIPEAATQAVHEVFLGGPPLALVAFDTPSVHDYVFRVRRPVDVAGGSHLVAAFTDRERAEEASICPVQEVLAREGHREGSLVFAGGGRGLAVVPAHAAERLRSRIEGVLADATRGDLRTVTGELSVWPEDLGPTAVSTNGDGRNGTASRYAAAVSVLMGRLARERSRGERFGETVEAKAPRCTACRHRVATQERPKTDERICAGCAARRDLGGRLKKEADEAKTFQDLVDEKDRRLAILYADGANVGAAFQEVDSMARHRALSEAVESAFDRALEEVVDREGLQDAEERQLYQLPIRGGDDAVVILPARSAFGAAVRLVRSVEGAFDLQRNRLLRDALGGAPPGLRSSVERFGVGIGIVFADCHFPVGFLVRYAEQLLKSAKRLIHNHCGGDAESSSRVRSAIDYLLLASGNPLSESIDRLRRAHFRVESRNGRPGLLLSERPLSIERLEQRLRGARVLRDAVPPTQRMAIRQEIFRGQALSRSLWRYQHARAKPGKDWARYRESLEVDLADVDGLLWRPVEPPPGSAGDEWLSTPYLDTLELLDLLPDSFPREPKEGRR